jgi:hypothetical protein
MNNLCSSHWYQSSVCTSKLEVYNPILKKNPCKGMDQSLIYRSPMNTIQKDSNSKVKLKLIIWINLTQTAAILTLQDILYQP